MSFKELWDMTKEHEDGNLPSDTLFIINCMWTAPEVKQDLHDEKPAINHLSFGTAPFAKLPATLNEIPYDFP